MWLVEMLSTLRALAARGMAAVKLARRRSMFEQIRGRFGRVSRVTPRRMDNEPAEHSLRVLPGVGYKVTRCVMLSSLDRGDFPVNALCFRTMDWLGCVRPGLAYLRDHNELQDIVPRGMRGPLHANSERGKAGRAARPPASPR